MTTRQRLPLRRYTETTSFSNGPHRFILSWSRFTTGHIAELFINTQMKSGSEADTNISDAAVAASLALQYGCPLATLAEAMKRNSDGSPTGPLAHALDILLTEEKAS